MGWEVGLSGRDKGDIGGRRQLKWRTSLSGTGSRWERPRVLRRSSGHQRVGSRMCGIRHCGCGGDIDALCGVGGEEGEVASLIPNY